MRLAICSKENLFLDSLAGFLGRRGNFTVVAKESSARALVASAKSAHAQVLIVDSEGLDAVDSQFLLGAKTFGDFIVALIGEKYVAGFDKETVDFLISRSMSGDDLVEKLQSYEDKIPSRLMVREGKRPYRRGNRLTHREFEVAELVAKGHSNRKISEVSGLREQSVKNLVSVIMRKLQCENRTQVALKLLNAEVEAPND